MSCNNRRSGPCCPDTPYPQVSHESTPSLIDNLVYALYGTISKLVKNGRVIWNIPCDPATTPASVPQIPRETGEGLLCYLIRIFTEICGQLQIGSPVGNLRWQFTGNGIQTSFALVGAGNANPSAYIVVIDGITQNPTIDYTISTSPNYTIEMTSPTPNQSVVIVVQINTTIAGWYIGVGSPENFITANIGSIYTNTNGGSGTTFWVKESGTETNTGWISK